MSSLKGHDLSIAGSGSFGDSSYHTWDHIDNKGFLLLRRQSYQGKAPNVDPVKLDAEMTI